MSNFSLAATELIERLNFSTGDGQCLAGWKASAFPTFKGVSGESYPLVDVIKMEPKTAYKGRVQQGTMNVHLLVATYKKNGFAEHVAAVAAVLNAVQLNRSTPRLADPGLAGTLMKPITLDRSDASVLDLSITTQITLGLETRPFEFGEA